jgi:hypothetical protein
MQVKARNPDAAEAVGFITCLARILPPLLARIVARLDHARPQCFGDPGRREKRLDFRCATRNASDAGDMRRAEYHYDSNSTSSNPAPPLQNHMFSLGKPGFLSGEDRNRTTYEFLGKLALRTNARLEIRRAQLHLSVLKFHPEKMRLSRVAERTSIT